MKEIKLLRETRGSVTIMAIGVMMFLGIILSGVLPMITQEVRSGTMNRDVVEAQYAAEAGLKRTIAAMQAGDTTWSWLGAARSFTGAAGKTYTVNFVTSGVCKTGRTYQAAPATGNPPASGWYCLQSVGTVNGATKTVSVAVELQQGGLSAALTNGVFGSSSITMNRNARVNGSVSTNGTLTMWGSSWISENATYQSIVPNTSQVGGVATPNSDPLGVPTFSTSFTVPSSSGASAWTLGNSIYSKSGLAVSTGRYLLASSFEMGNSDITSAANTSLFFNGMTMNSGSRVTQGDNAMLVINGDLALNGARLVFLGAGSLYVTGNFTLNSNSVLTIGGNTKIYVSGNVALNNSQIVTGSNADLLIKSAGNLNLNSGSTIISGTGSSVGLLIKGNVEMNADTSLNKALLIANGNIQLNRNASLLGAAVSNGGNIILNNNATVTYDATMVQSVVQDNPSEISGGGSGASSTSPVEWKSQ